MSNPAPLQAFQSTSEIGSARNSYAYPASMTQSMSQSEMKYSFGNNGGGPNSESFGGVSPAENNQPLDIDYENNIDGDNPPEQTCLQKFFGHSHEDSFTQTLRKLSAVLNIVVAPFALAYGVYWILMGATGSEGSGAGSIIMGVLSIILSIILVTNFVLVKVWKEVTDFHVTVFLWAMLVPCWCTVIGTPEFGSRMLLIWYSMMAVTNQSNHAVVQCTVALIGQLLSCYNNAYSNERGGTPLILPGARIYGPNLEVFGELAGATVVSNSVVIAVYLQGRVYSETYKQAQQGKAARAAVEMTTKVVDLLRKYDTDGVGEALKAYSQSAVDPELLRSFKKMKLNLETYRPHLPNYVFQDDEEGADDDDNCGGDDSEGDVPSTGGESFLSPRPSAASPTGPLGKRQDTTNSTKLLNSPGSVAASPRTSRVLSPSQSPIKNQHLERSIDRRRRSSINSVLQQGAQQYSQPVGRKIAVGLLDCHHLTKSGSSDFQLQQMVNSIFLNASETRGSIHSIVGDVVKITWNAMARVAAPEAKAAKFLCRVQKDALAKGYIISGCAGSGQSRCHSVLSSTKQQVHLVHYEWNPALLTIFKLARRYRAFLVDKNTSTTAQYDVDFRVVDQVLYSHPSEEDEEPGGYGELLLDRQISGKQSTGGGEVPDLNPEELRRGPLLKSLVFEVLNEIKHEEDEWMYQLEKREKKEGDGKGGEGNSVAVIQEALDEVIKGNFGDALAQLNDLERGVNPGDLKAFRAPLIQRLVHHCEQQLVKQ